MMTKLQRLLQSIDPEIVYRPVERNVNQALEGFPVPDVTPTPEKYEALLDRLVGHVDRLVFRCSAWRGDRETHLAAAWELLKKAYGANGRVAAFEIARTGVQGGARAVVRTVALGLAKQYAETEIKAKVDKYWRGLTVAEQLEAPAAYLAEYGRFLPKDLTERGAIRVHAGFPAVLRLHPQLIQQLRRVAR